MIKCLVDRGRVIKCLVSRGRVTKVQWHSNRGREGEGIERGKEKER